MDEAGLAALFAALDAYGDRLLDAYEVGEALNCKPRTVTFWATSRQLSGVLPSKAAGWGFTAADVKAFVRRHYVVAAA